MPPTRPKLKGAMAETETSENESSESSDDDMPLSTLIPPRRPGSAMSGARPASPAASARSVPSTPNSLSTPQSAHSRTPNAGAIGTLDQGRQPLVNLSAPIQKDTGKPLQLPAAPAARKTSPLRSKRSFKNVGNGPAPSTPSSSSPSLRPSLPNDSPAVHVRQLSPTNTTETITRTTIQAGTPSSPKSAPEPESVPRFMVPRPFAHMDSPPSSIGNSSWSGKLPLTPQTGSEAGGSSTSGSGDQGDKKAERRKRTVSFVEPEPGKKDEKKAKGTMHRREESDSLVEDKRKERRKSEARASIEVHISRGKSDGGLTFDINSLAGL